MRLVVSCSAVDYAQATSTSLQHHGVVTVAAVAPMIQVVTDSVRVQSIACVLLVMMQSYQITSAEQHCAADHALTSYCMTGPEIACGTTETGEIDRH